MGRKGKFGEESDFVSVRVLKSKRKEYRIAIRDFVEKKFATETSSIDETSTVKINKKESKGYRKFEEFITNLKNQDEKGEDK